MAQSVDPQKLSLFTLHAVWFDVDLNKIMKHTYNHLLEDTKEDAVHAWGCLTHLMDKEVHNLPSDAQTQIDRLINLALVLSKYFVTMDLTIILIYFGCSCKLFRNLGGLVSN